MTAVLLSIVDLADASETFEGRRFSLGDLHVHTGVSGDGGSSDVGSCAVDGGCGALSEVLAIARANGLDFVASADHVNGNMAATTEGWEAMKAAYLASNGAEGDVVAILGAEEWFFLEGVGQLGHKTLLLFGDDVTLRGVTLPDVQPAGSQDIRVAQCDDIWSWMAALDAKAGPALLIPHHPATRMPMPNDWSCHDDQWEVAVELYSRHGSSEAFGTAFDPPWSGTEPTGTVSYALGEGGAGLTLGFVGGTDSHDTEPGAVCELDVEHTNHPYGGGLTITVTELDRMFDRTAIYDAIRDRHTYVTSGPLVPVVLDWSSQGERIGGMGDLAVLTEGSGLTGEVRVPVEWDPYVLGVELVGAERSYVLTSNGTGSWSIDLNAEQVQAWGYVVLTIDGAAWYGAGMCEDGGSDSTERVWLSPTWFELEPREEPPPPDTDEPGDPVDTDVPAVDTGTISRPPAVRDGVPVEVDDDPEPEPSRGCDTAGGLGSAWIVALAALSRGRRARRP